MAKTPHPFQLPDEGRRSLKQLLKKGIHPARKLNRARILLKLDQGLGPTQVAREVGLSPGTVYNVRAKATQQGWQDALGEQPRQGRPPEISGTARAEITALACADPPKGYARWSFRLLADRAVEFGFVESISHEAVRGILKKTSSNPT